MNAILSRSTWCFLFEKQQSVCTDRIALPTFIPDNGGDYNMTTDSVFVCLWSMTAVSKNWRRIWLQFSGRQKRSGDWIFSIPTLGEKAWGEFWTHCNDHIVWHTASKFGAITCAYMGWKGSVGLSANPRTWLGGCFVRCSSYASVHFSLYILNQSINQLFKRS